MYILIRPFYTCWAGCGWWRYKMDNASHFPSWIIKNHAPKQWNQSVPPTKMPFKKSTTTPPKTNMEPQNGPLEKEIPIGNHHFQVPCWISGGCTKTFLGQTAKTPKNHTLTQPFHELLGLVWRCISKMPQHEMRKIYMTNHREYTKRRPGTTPEFIANPTTPIDLGISTKG